MRYLVILALTARVVLIPTDLYAQSTSPGVRTQTAELSADVAAVNKFRPAYTFWQHIFVIPDGRIVYGSAADGRLLATFPTRGDWSRDAIWEQQPLSTILVGQRLPSRLRDRREEMERLLKPVVSPVVHNPTRGRFLSPHADRYGRFWSEWGAIYERLSSRA